MPDKDELTLRQIELEERERDRRDRESQERAGAIGLIVITCLAAAWYCASESLILFLLAVLILGLAAACVWFLFSNGILISPFSIESRADRLERRKIRHLRRITGRQSDAAVTYEEVTRRNRVEATYNARISRLIDKL